MIREPHISPAVSGASTGRTFAVLVVCTGNICRSPAVERLLMAGLGDDSGVVVTSAGTRAMVGHPVSGPMVPLMATAGAVADGFVARQLTAELITEADLVVVMTRKHRSAVVGLAPSSVRRTFTLRELARIAGDVDQDALPDGTPAERLAALVKAAAGQRSAHRGDAGLDDVSDPYRRGEAAYARSFEELEPAVRVLVAVVRR